MSESEISHVNNSKIDLPVNGEESLAEINHTPLGSFQQTLVPFDQFSDNSDKFSTDLFSETFDPGIDFEELQHIPKSERREAYEKFQEKLVEQAKGYARLRVDLTQAFKKDPFISFDDLYIIAEEYKYHYGFPEDSMTLIDRTIHMALTRRKQVNDLYDNVQGVTIDEKNSILCQRLFNFEPSGMCYVVKSSLTLNFYFHDSDDYAKAWLMSNSKPITQDAILAARDSSGGFYQLKPDAATIAVNMKYAPTKVIEHEEEHAFYDVFQDVAMPTIEFPKKIAAMPQDGRIPEAMERLVKRRMLEYRKNPLDRAKDEIFAFLTESRLDFDGIYKMLTKLKQDGGLYDYSASFRANMDALYKDPAYDPDVQSNMNDIVQKIFVRDYREILQKALNTFQEVEKLGYSKEEVMGMFVAIPLQKWHRMGRRIQEVRKVQQRATPEELMALVNQFKKPEIQHENSKSKQKSNNRKKHEEEQLDAVLQTLEKYKI